MTWFRLPRNWSRIGVAQSLASLQHIERPLWKVSKLLRAFGVHLAAFNAGLLMMPAGKPWRKPLLRTSSSHCICVHSAWRTLSHGIFFTFLTCSNAFKAIQKMAIIWKEIFQAELEFQNQQPWTFKESRKVLINPQERLRRGWTSSSPRFISLTLYPAKYAKILPKGWTVFERQAML